MKIAIAGADGFVGRNLIKYLHPTQHDVLAIVNYKKGNSQITELGADEFLETDYQDYTQIQNALRDVDSLIHLVGDTSNPHHVEIGITTQLVDLVNDSGIQRFVYISGLGVGTEKRVVDYLSNLLGEAEAKRVMDRHDLPSQIPYFELKRMQEKIIHSEVENFTIFRPSYIIGPKGSIVTSYYNQAKKGREIEVIEDGSYMFQPIFIGDVCEVIRHTLEQSKNGIFDTVGPDVISMNEFLEILKEKIEFELQTINIPITQKIDEVINQCSDRNLNSILIEICSETANTKTLEADFGVSLTPIADAIEKSLPNMS